jgi:hypothetical protein
MLIADRFSLVISSPSSNPSHIAVAAVMGRTQGEE